MRSPRGLLLHGEWAVPGPSAVVIVLPPGAAIFVVGLAPVVILPVGWVRPLEGESKWWL